MNVGAAIVQQGSPGNFSYTVVGSPNNPVTHVYVDSALRFANWLHNGQPTGRQNASTTEDGAYTLTFGRPFPVRNPGATWFLPTENEWYKAAYYQPADKGGDVDGYWLYPTATNTLPVSAPPGSTPNGANYFDPVTGFAVTGSATFDPNADYLTDVGAYTASASYYGTFDQGGNVMEWNETVLLGMSGLRGGSWSVPASELASTGYPINLFLGTQSGFRMAAIASVPEPSGIALAAVAIVGLIALGRRKRA